MKRIFRIYRFVLKYPAYLIFGVISLLGYAVFSGVSITLVIPVFDNIFIVNRTVEPIYTSYTEFYDAISERFAQLTLSLSKDSLTAMWQELKAVFELSDPWLLLKVICGVLVILFLLKNIFYFLNRLMFVNLRGRTIKDIRNACYQKYLSQSYAFFNQNRVGDSIVRMINDIEMMNNFFIDKAFKILRDASQVTICAFIALSLNARLFMLSILIFPVFIFSIQFIMKKIKKYAKRIQAKLSDMFSKIEEVLNSMRIVKAFNKEDYEHDHLVQLNKQHFKFWRKSQVYWSFGVPISEISTVLIGITILFIGGADILNTQGNFTFGDFTAFLLAVFSMMHPLKALSNDMADMKRAMVSVHRISDILELKNEIVECENPISKNDFTDKIEFNNVIFTYDSPDSPDSYVLKNINIEIKNGQKVAFVGASGSGKTTLINLINRMYDATAGEILIDGINVKKIKISDLRKLFGVVTQESILFAETIENNILYGLHNTKRAADLSPIQQVKEACQFAYADEFIDNLPDGYQTMIMPHGSNFSGGQKQRLCIARAIIGNPPILIFDEATSALDTESEQKVQKAIDQATGNRTVIIIAHRLSTILSADVIFVVDKGEIVGAGKHEELILSCPQYKLYHDLQFNG